jgi:hypothetical protein
VKPSATDWIVICSCGLLTIGIVEAAKFGLRWRRAALLVYQ